MGDIDYTEVHFYVKLTFCIALFGGVVYAFVKTIDGVVKHLRTYTPVMFLVYFLFLLGAAASIVLVFINRRLVLDSRDGKTTDELLDLILAQLWIQQAYETIYWMT